MKTEVEMERKLFGVVVRQKSKSEFFCASELVKAGNKWRVNNGLAVLELTEFLRTKQTIAFIAELKASLGVTPIIRGRGRSAVTWVHPYLFIDIALAMNPKLKIEVYSWIYDELLKYRNDSGDSFKLMSGALYARHKNKQSFIPFIKQVSIAIQKNIGCCDWQKATQEQLLARDKLHVKITTLVNALHDNDLALNLALTK